MYTTVVHIGAGGWLVTCFTELSIEIIQYYYNSLRSVLLYTAEHLYCGHHWDRPKCPDWRGVLISEVVLYTEATFGTPAESVLIIELSLFQSVLIREVPLYFSYYSWTVLTVI